MLSNGQFQLLATSILASAAMAVIVAATATERYSDPYNSAVRLVAINSNLQLILDTSQVLSIIGFLSTVILDTTTTSSISITTPTWSSSSTSAEIAIPTWRFPALSVEIATLITRSSDASTPSLAITLVTFDASSTILDSSIPITIPTKTYSATNIWIATLVTSSSVASISSSKPTTGFPAATSQHDHDLSAGTIAGIAIAAISFLAALAFCFLRIRRKQRQWGRKTTMAAAGHRQSLEEAEEYIGKPELDAQETINHAGTVGNEERSAPCSPVSGPPPVPLHSRPNIPDVSANNRSVVELSADHAAYFHPEL